MQTHTQTQALSQVPLMAPENYTDDAQRLRAFASDPNKTHVERAFMCAIVTRQKMFGTITQEQVDTMTAMQLADLIEMGVQ